MRSLPGFGLELSQRIIEADGRVGEWSAWEHNALLNEGERLALRLLLRNEPVLNSFALRLTGDIPVETDSLASLDTSLEPGGLAGYSHVVLNRNTTDWPTLSEEGGDATVTSKTVSFTATNTWPTARNAFLATSSDSTGLLVDSTTLPQVRALVSGETMQFKFRAKLS